MEIQNQGSGYSLAGISVSTPDALSNEGMVHSRLRQQLGEDREFELVWVGPYAYRTQLLDNMRHGRVFFLGDAAHVMSPFGGRGGNSGIQDAENLAWKRPGQPFRMRERRTQTVAGRLWRRGRRGHYQILPIPNV